MEDAANFGFPFVELYIEFTARSWDTSIHAGLCRFLQGKGFDPDSQNAARHPRCQSYQSSNELLNPIRTVRLMTLEMKLPATTQVIWWETIS